MTGPMGNSEICIPEPSLSSKAEPRETSRVEGKQNSLCPMGPVMCFVMPPNSNTFRDCRRTCYVSWVKTHQLFRAGRTNLTYSLGKQRLEFSIRMWSGRVPCNRGKSVCQSTRCQVAQHFSLETRLKIIRLTKGKIWTFCVSKPLVWRQKFDRCRQVGKYFCNLQQNMLFVVWSHTGQHHWMLIGWDRGYFFLITRALLVIKRAWLLDADWLNTPALSWFPASNGFWTRISETHPFWVWSKHGYFILKTLCRQACIAHVVGFLVHETSNLLLPINSLFNPL